MGIDHGNTTRNCLKAPFLFSDVSLALNVRGMIGFNYMTVFKAYNDTKNRSKYDSNKDKNDINNKYFAKINEIRN